MHQLQNFFDNITIKMELKNDDHKYILDDHNYGKGGVKILHLVRNGKKS